MELDEKKYDSLSFSIILIIVSVIAGNWVSMFGLDTPIFDDLYGQIFALENEISWRFPIRNPIGPIMKYYIMELLTINIYFARAIFVIFAAIPLSLAFFWFYRNILGINNIVAATAAAIPNILPGQDIIFHSLIQSYMVYYMIPTLLALIIGVKYLKGKKSIFTLMAALFLYLFACTSVEQAVFLFVPFSFIFLITARFSRRHVILISSFFVIALSKTIYTLLFPWNVTTPMSHSLNEIIRRCTLFFGYALPFPVDLSSILHSNPLYFVIIPVMLILVSGFLVGFFWPHKTNIISEKCLTAFSSRKKWLLLYLFGSIWTICTFIPFLTSYAYRSRHVYVATFGFNLILILSMLSISHIIINKKRMTTLIICLLVIFVAVTGRNVLLARQFEPYNRYYSFISKGLNYNFPENSQIVLFGTWFNEIKPCPWQRLARGYLVFVTKRKDISGFLPVEYNYYDPFLKGHPWGHPRGYRFKELDKTYPLFIYRFNSINEKLIPVDYAIRWFELTKDSPWIVYKLDTKTGEMETYSEGEGYEEYQKFLKKAEKDGINQSDIAWGGLPSEEEKKRLGL